MSARVCAVDVGTNTLLALIAERTGTTLRVLHDVAHLPRLGRGLEARRRLAADAIERALAALRDVVDRALFSGVARERIAAVGTSALRDADDADEFLARAAAELGLHIEVITGRREAELAFAGALPQQTVAPCEAITVIDIGGGSTEIATGRGRTLQRGVSLDVGSVRLFERHLRHDPPTVREVEALRADVDRALDASEARFEGRLVVLAGTACTLACVARDVHPFDARAVHGTRLALHELRRVTERLLRASVRERRAIRGVPPGREDVIAAGALLLERLVERAGAPEVTVSDGGVRWGLALQMLGC